MSPILKFLPSCISLFLLPLPQGSAATGLLDIRVENVSASGVVQLLRTQHCAAVSFIEASQAKALSLDLRQVTVSEVLREIAERDPAYRSETIGARQVLYPATSEFQEVLGPLTIQGQPRQSAAEIYVDVIRKQVSAFSDLVPPVLFGDERHPLYKDAVSLRERGRVIEHFVDLLGKDQSLYFEFIEARSGLPSLAFGRVPCAGSNPTSGSEGCGDQ